MKAIQVKRNGGPDVLELVDLPVPVPRAGEARVRMACAGINFADGDFREGARGIPLPFVMGTEGAGVVETCASDVAGVAPGDRVVFFDTTPGTYAEYKAVPAWRLVKVPDGIDLQVACAALVQGLTAHYLTHSTFRLGRGHTCLMLPAASGVGQLLIQIAKALGARVIAAASNEEKCAVARACGADETFIYDGSDFSPKVRALTDGVGVDVAYDSAGAATFQSSIASVRKCGTCIVFGGSSGKMPPFDTAVLTRSGSIAFVRPSLPDYTQTAEELGSRMKTIFGLIEQGKLKVPAIERIPLANAADAHRRLTDRRHVSKMVLTMA